MRMVLDENFKISIEGRNDFDGRILFLSKNSGIARIGNKGWDFRDAILGSGEDFAIELMANGQAAATLSFERNSGHSIAVPRKGDKN